MSKINSDLVGSDKVLVSDMECGQLYLDKKNGIVVLTSNYNKHLGLVVHSASHSFEVGDSVRMVESHPGEKIYLLTGKVVLSNG